MRSTNLAFETDYLYGRELDDNFNLLTEDYIFKCDNYSVGYNLIQIIDHMEMCEHSNIVDDCFWPYSWIIFITCRPKDILRIKHIAERLPSSIPSNIKIISEEGEEEI